MSIIITDNSRNAIIFHKAVLDRIYTQRWIINGVSTERMGYNTRGGVAETVRRFKSYGGYKIYFIKG